MDLGLKDDVIVITGGASGIGQAITRACVAEGARIVVLSRLSAGVAEFIAEMQQAGHACELRVIELDNVVDCQAAIASIVEQHGRIDAIVNNAAVNDGVGLESGSADAFLASLRINLLPSYVLTQAALPSLKQSRGSIVNIGSKVALTGQGNTSGYAAAKGGLLALTREWAVELLPYGIRVNAVLPAEVMTPAYETWLATLQNPEETLAHITAQVPLERRMTRPEEIAASVVFLLSPTQSSHTTGQQLLVDGGYVHLDRMATSKQPLQMTHNG